MATQVELLEQIRALLQPEPERVVEGDERYIGKLRPTHRELHHADELLADPGAASL